MTPEDLMTEVATRYSVDESGVATSRNLEDLARNALFEARAGYESKRAELSVLSGKQTKLKNQVADLDKEISSTNLDALTDTDQKALETAARRRASLRDQQNILVDALRNLESGRVTLAHGAVLEAARNVTSAELRWLQAAAEREAVKTLLLLKPVLQHDPALVVTFDKGSRLQGY